jgi:hypothetical protein
LLARRVRCARGNNRAPLRQKQAQKTLARVSNYAPGIRRS